MPTRQLGANGPYVPALGFGAMGLSTAYSTPCPDEQRLKLLDRAWEIGLRFWDSADLYGKSRLAHLCLISALFLISQL
jgi:aryl-alcohol dehydrogenase-like predicted oxidoreductase